VEESGRVYGGVSAIKQFVTEDWLRMGYGTYNTPEVVDENVIQEQMSALGDDADELDSLESEVEESVSETEGEDSLDSVSSNSVSSLSENSISQDT
jgi:hypothetical protein